MNTPLHGFNYLIEGFRLLTERGIKRYVVMPVLVNVIFFIGLFLVLQHYAHVFNAWFLGTLPTWLQWLAYVLWLIFFASFFLFFIYAFVTIANFIAAPFNSLLSEKVERHLTGKEPTNARLRDTFADIPRMLKRQLSIFAYYLPRVAILLILFFVPVIQVFAAPLWFLFNAWFMAISYVDYPSDNHRVPIDEVREWLTANRWLSFGFGLAVLITSMIPFINFFTIPAAVAGATKLWVIERKKV